MFPRINPTDIVVCWKTSKWDIDLVETAFTAEQLDRRYRVLKRDPARARESAARQASSRDIVGFQIPPNCFVPRGQLSRPLLEKKSLLVMAGGDNHAIWGAHYLPPEMPVVFLNSDFTGRRDEGSYGGLLYFDAQDFVRFLPQLLVGDYEVEEWTLIETRVGDHPPVLTVSEAYFGEQDATDFSGLHVEIKGEEPFRHFGSGPLVATGAGSFFGSWLISAADGTDFCVPKPPTDRAIYFVGRERNRLRDEKPQQRFYRVPEGSVIKLTSMNDSEGIFRSDSVKSYPFTLPFPQGEVATVRVARERLRVVKNPFRKQSV